MDRWSCPLNLKWDTTDLGPRQLFCCWILRILDLASRLCNGILGILDPVKPFLSSDPVDSESYFSPRHMFAHSIRHWWLQHYEICTVQSNWKYCHFNFEERFLGTQKYIFAPHLLEWGCTLHPRLPHFRRHWGAHVRMGGAFQRKLVGQNGSLTGCSALQQETECRNV